MELGHKKEGFLLKVHQKRVRNGFCDDLGITERIVEACARKNLGRTAFMRAVLTDTLETTQDPNPHRIESSRHYLLDLAVMQHLDIYSKEKIRFLDLGCGIAGGYSPTAEDTVKMMERLGIGVEAVAVDRKVPNSINKKEIRGVFYLKADIFRDDLESLGEFDYIRCMNVLYYFDPAVASAAVEKFRKMLSVGGILAEDSQTQKRKTVVRLHQRYSGGAAVVSEGDFYLEN